MTSKDIEKLEQADRLMLNINNSNDPKTDILKVGQLLKEVKILEDDANLNTIIDTYNQNAQSEIKKSLKKEMAAIVKFDLKAIEPYLNDTDEIVSDLPNRCLSNFKQYGQIVLRFNDKKITWKAEKSREEYQQTFHQLDEKRHNIHNECINSIAEINRLISNDSSNKRVFAAWDNPNIKNIKEVPRSDIGNAILEQYLDNLIYNDQNILKQLAN